MKKNLFILSGLFMIFLFSACGVSGIIDDIDILEILFVNPIPASGSTEIERNLVLGWDVDTDVEGDIVSYSVYLDQNPNPNTLLGTTENKTFQVNGLDYSTKHYWKIVANHNSGISVSSSVWNFTTKGEPFIQGQRRGITIGVTDYGGEDDLDYTDDDADSIKITFENLSNTYTMQKQTGNIVKNQILNWVNAYVAGSSSNDVFVFQYSGHGYYSGGQSRLYLSDGSNISMTELRTVLSAINGTKIVLIDACESGNFTELSSGREWSDLERIQQMERFNQGVIEAFKEDPERRGTYDSDYEYYVLTGATINQYSFEDEYLKQGYFSFFFADGLGNVGTSNPNAAFDYSYNADGYGPNGILDGEVTYTEIYHYSKDKVQEYIDDKWPGEVQTIQGNHTTADFVIGIYD
ncbi:MAG: caspase family protein [Thermotogota bacterium]